MSVVPLLLPFFFFALFSYFFLFLSSDNDSEEDLVGNHLASHRRCYRCREKTIRAQCEGCGSGEDTDLCMSCCLRICHCIEVDGTAIEMEPFNFDMKA